MGNDSETDRYTADVIIDDRTLRELYLTAFERGVRDAHAWAVMSAYNSVNGATATESPLLTEPLTGEWGFDGVVVSDWTAVRSLESALQPQDLAMPGPDGPWGAALVAAVLDGRVPETLIDRKVRRILRLAARVGALEGTHPMPIGEIEDGRDFARLAAAEGMVLLRNEAVLPLNPTTLTRIAVIGEYAKTPRIQGGGSATVLPDAVVSPLDGLRAALPSNVHVEYRLGARVQDGFTALVPERMQNPATGEPGARLTYFDSSGGELYAEDRLASLILDFAPREEDRRRTSLRFETRYLPSSTGELRIGFASPGTGRLTVNGRIELEATLEDDSDQVQSFFLPSSVSTPVAVTAEQPIELSFDFTPGAIVDGVPGSISVTFGIESGPRDAEQDQALIDDAAAIAAMADVVIVIVGTGTQAESEGFDRTTLRLPGEQDALVSAIAKSNPQTIVVVNAGAPVEMPWRYDVAAVLLAWFGGQEIGHALADVLLGKREPGGRLPTTWPARAEDCPVINVTPDGGRLVYSEGLHIGYRAWLRSDRLPAFPFGFGLGYTTWTLSPATTALTDDGFTISLAVTNTGALPGKQIIQVYARRPESTIDRPEQWLIGFDVVRADAGRTALSRVHVPIRHLMHWDSGWHIESGDFEILVGTSVQDVSSRSHVAIKERFAAALQDPSA